VHEPLFGIETEYAFAAWTAEPSASLPGREALLEELLLLARRRLDHIRDSGGAGLFLGNGARFYIDAGNHPELCTPECQRPVDVVRWALACERTLAELTAELEQCHPGLRLAVFRGNVDYASSRTWGCHESYLVSMRSPHDVVQHLTSHLITRIVFAGSGGFNNLNKGREFLLSPRAPHMKGVAVWSSMNPRALVHDRNEPLCRGYHRLHLMCGESLSSQLANYLKMGTTALIVRLAEAGHGRGRELAFEKPLRAMMSFSRDPACGRRARLADGRHLTALEVQRSYLEDVESCLDRDFMPEWAPEVCRVWRHVLDQLDEEPEALATRLDWAIKLALYRGRGMGAVRPRGRADLFELDTLFGELGERGLFNELDRAGALHHRLPDLGSIERAMREAPPGGRAEARGRAIRELGRPGSDCEGYVGNWDAIRDRGQQRVLVMDDPFDREPAWRPAPPPARRKRAPASRPDPGVNAAIHLYHSNHPARAAASLRQCVRDAAGSPERDGDARFWYAAALQDLGRAEEALSALEPALASTRDDASAETAARVWTRFGLLLIERPAPLPEIVSHLAEADRVCRARDETVGRSRLGLLEARLLGARGRYPEAIARMEQALQDSSSDPVSFSGTSYWRWLIRFFIRARDWRGARAFLSRWRDEAPGRDSSVALAIAEAELQLAQGRPGAAWRAALEATRGSNEIRDHRSRVAACSAFIRAAVELGKLQQARERLPELLRWRHVSLGAIRYEVRAVHLAYAAAALGTRERPGAQAAHERARRAAEREARWLDHRLESTHRMRELELSPSRRSRAAETSRASGIYTAEV
jgi:proteasome accessory factor A